MENGIPLQGTWTQAFDEVDLLDIQRPFSLPTPRALRDIRIKEWESFVIQNDQFYLEACLVNVKYYGVAQVCLYDKETRERLRFQKLVPFSRWRLPKNLWNSSLNSHSYGFFFRIHDWLDADTIKVDLDIEATRKRPSFTAHVEYNLDKTDTPMAVNLLFSERRCAYAFKVFSAVRGDMVFGGRHIYLDPGKTTGIFRDYKGFYPYHMRSIWCTACGADGENRRYGFSLGETAVRENYKHNENALWLNGRLTPLPPVRITMPNGVESDWIIQDIEGMVDLTFTPQVQSRSAFNVILTSWKYNTPLGYYNGMLVNNEGTQIPVRNLWGLGEKLYLRI